jgi:hypothetical protein
MKGAMRPPAIVVGHILPQHTPKMPLIDDDQMIQTLSAQRAYHSFGDSVRLGCLDRGEYGFNAQPGCPWVEAAAIASVAVT